MRRASAIKLAAWAAVMIVTALTLAVQMHGFAEPGESFGGYLFFAGMLACGLHAGVFWGLLGAWGSHRSVRLRFAAGSLMLPTSLACLGLTGELIHKGNWPGLLLVGIISSVYVRAWPRIVRMPRQADLPPPPGPWPGKRSVAGERGKLWWARP